MVKVTEGRQNMAKKGRPKSENPRSFTIPEVRVTKEEKNMFALKAGFLGGSTATLIRKAVEAYQPQLQPSKCCGVEMKIIKETEEFQFRFGDSEYTVTVENIPHWKCVKCGTVKGGLFLLAAVEDVIEQKMFDFIKSRRSIPKSITFDFEKLIKTG